MLKNSFISPQNITFDSYYSFSRIHKKGKNHRKILYISKKKLAENCNFESHCQNKVIRDVIIMNLSDSDIQCALLQGTVAPNRALSFSLDMGVGQLNQDSL